MLGDGNELGVLIPLPFYIQMRGFSINGTHSRTQSFEELLRQLVSEGGIVGRDCILIEHSATTI